MGYEPAKLVLGRLRHLLVDTFGLVLMVVVTAASVPERAGAKLVFARLERVRSWVNRFVLIWVDGGYQGQDFRRFVMDTHRWIVQAVLRKDTVKCFMPIVQRLKVERTFGWFNWYRRLSKDYEILPQTSVALNECCKHSFNASSFSLVHFSDILLDNEFHL